MCGKGYIACTNFGSLSCYDVLSYCSQTHPPCESDLDKRICEVGVLDQFDEVLHIYLYSFNH